MGKKNEAELWNTIRERLSPQDLKTLISLSHDFNDGRIGYTQLIASALRLFKNEGFLHRCFNDLIQEDEDGETQNDEGEVREGDSKTECVRNKESTRDRKESEREVEEATAMAYDVGQEDVAICEIVDKLFSEKLMGPSELPELISLVQDKQKISYSEFRESLLLLLENAIVVDEDVKAKQDVEDRDLEEGEIREDRLLLRDTTVEQAESNRRATRDEADEKSKEDPKIGADAEIRVSDERELEKHVTNGLDKMNLEGKKRTILKPEQNESSPKKTRRSRRFQVVTPSYEFILEEEQSPVKHEVLNKECRLKKFGNAFMIKKLTKYEEVLARCEDNMYEANMLTEALKSAVEKAEKVMREEMSVKDLGTKFYRCIEMLYREHFQDVIEAVRQDHKKALPVILGRLKQKQVELKAALKKWKPIWKKVIKENTEKQRESTETRTMWHEKVKENRKF